MAHKNTRKQGINGSARNAHRQAASDWPTSWSDPRLGATARFHGSSNAAAAANGQSRMATTPRLGNHHSRSADAVPSAKPQSPAGTHRPNSVFIGQSMVMTGRADGNRGTAAKQHRMSPNQQQKKTWEDQLPALWLEAQEIDQQMHCMGWRKFSSIADLQKSSA
mmetsp:Transcript_5561/g.16508  ORF Transcript_5561/g.16508 Transcript_5561/m.16508 type:complete len:164 (+) Transcript_5561:158-649(+)|eukprot:CAMPEP_0119561794 /NCGR_PEP_ID=MMETSP1352-20130426/18657_1 /TAXON_ID=265584 /ORGANISM="Stauroneis constricta, Strain CCMP1120" /LENGTH=163 /DNA_ID=CAMNT_0007610081 /DNA_START=97 /DNA_END=588 /DNA_ORIENTATION=+